MCRRARLLLRPASGAMRWRWGWKRSCWFQVWRTAVVDRADWCGGACGGHALPEGATVSVAASGVGE